MARDALEGTDGNGNLLHSDPNSPTTTRDALDLGAPMLTPETKRQQGPEDALGLEPTRGDYSDRLGSGISTTMVRVDAPDGQSHTVAVDQKELSRARNAAQRAANDEAAQD